MKACRWLQITWLQKNACVFPYLVSICFRWFLGAYHCVKSLRQSSLHFCEVVSCCDLFLSVVFQTCFVLFLFPSFPSPPSYHMTVGAVNGSSIEWEEGTGKKRTPQTCQRRMAIKASRRSKASKTLSNNIGACQSQWRLAKGVAWTSNVLHTLRLSSNFVFVSRAEHYERICMCNGGVNPGSTR